MIIVRSIFIWMIFFLFISNPAYAYKDNFHLSKHNSIVGSWRFKVDVPNLPTFLVLQTFHKDHTFVDANSMNPSVESSAHGVWKKIDRNKYAVTAEFFSFDEDKTLTGTIRARLTIFLNDIDHASGYAVLDFIDLDGNVMPEINSATFTGKRIKLVLTD